MPKEIKNITENVMEQIKQGEIKMKSKTYFIIGSILTFIGLISSIVVSIFLVGLVRFSLRAHGPMAEYRMDQIISNFPWWTLVLAVCGLFIGILLIRKYDFSYKKSPWIIIIGFILAIFTAGWLVDIAGFNDTLLRRGPAKGMMKNYSQKYNNGINRDWRK